MTHLRTTLGVLLSGAALAAGIGPADGAGEPGSATVDPSPTHLTAPALSPAMPRPQSYDELNAPYDGLFHFVRVRYEPRGRGGFGFGRRGGREPMWAHDYPRAERNFLDIIEETTFVASQTEGSNVLALDDPDLFKYPVAYMVEVGSWDPTEEEVRGLGDYLLKGGFLIVDDTRDERGDEWANFAFHMSRALPGLNLVELPLDHEIFDSFFRIDPLAVIPPYGPRNPLYYGIYEDNDPTKRLLVMFNFNNDIAEYWEYSDRGFFPIDLSNEAYKLGVNYIVYAHTH